MLTEVLLTDRAGTPFGPVPAAGLSYESRLGGGGQADFTLRTDHPVISGLNVGNLDTWATEVLVLREDEPQFSGPVVDLDGNAVSGHVQVKAAAATQWLARRFVLHDLSFTSQEQLDILTSLVEYAQDPAFKGANADCRLTVTGDATGVLRTGKHLAAERGNVLDLVQAMTTLADGFDLTLDLSRVGGAIMRTLHAHYPAAGAAAVIPLKLGQGGLTALTVKRDGDAVATRILATGNGEGSDQLRSTALADPDLEARYGVHEKPLSITDVKEQATLQAHADGALVLGRPPLQVVGASYRVVPGTPFNLAGLGDTVQVQADRGWLQLDTRLRVVARKVTVASSGAESVDLTFNAPVEAAA